ncbi:MAG: type II secretion system protein [Terracidiphilus sp.]
MPTPIRRRPSEEGYILIAVMFLLALLVISLAIAAPIVRKDFQRDREIETMHRGKQYVRAVKMYYKKFGAYPPSIDALVNTNQIRFLRKKYIDPTTGKDEWKIIRFGQNKTPTIGFFGQPIGNIPGCMGTGLNNPLTAGSGASSSSGSSSFSGSSGSTSDVPTGAAGCSTDTSGTTGGSTDSSSGSGNTGATGSTDSNAPNGSSSTGSGTGLTGQTFGGGGIIGVSPGSPKQSILVYKKKNHYNEWEFFYDPLAEQMMMQGGGNLGTIGQPASATTTPIGGTTPPAPIPPPAPAPPTPQQ